MNQITLSKDAIIGGKQYPAGTQVLVASQEVAQRGYKDARRAAARHQINQMTGADEFSLLGTTNKTTQMLLWALCNIVVGLSSANSFHDLRAACEPYKDISQGFLDQVASGEVQLAHQGEENGIPGIVAEFSQRASQIFQALNGTGTTG